MVNHGLAALVPSRVPARLQRDMESGFGQHPQSMPSQGVHAREPAAVPGGVEHSLVRPRVTVESPV